MYDKGEDSCNDASLVVDDVFRAIELLEEL